MTGPDIDTGPRPGEPPPRHVNWGSSVNHAAGWSYERLAGTRAAAARVRDSGFTWIHEQAHLDEIIERIDATLRLKHERDQEAREKG
jgi:hypothetical protein